MNNWVFDQSIGQSTLNNASKNQIENSVGGFPRLARIKMIVSRTLFESCSIFTPIRAS